jgi:hypothetical protein
MAARDSPSRADGCRRVEARVSVLYRAAQLSTCLTTVLGDRAGELSSEQRTHRLAPLPVGRMCAKRHANGPDSPQARPQPVRRAPTRRVTLNPRGRPGNPANVRIKATASWCLVLARIVHETPA